MASESTRQLPIILALGTTQTLAWASSYYLPAILADRDNIREVIAFPKATSGADPLTGAPAPVDDIQLRELGLRLR